MRFWPVLLCLPIAATAADHPCDAAFPDACVDPSTTVSSEATVGNGARIGPDMAIGDVAIGRFVVLDGRDAGGLAQPVGDDTFIGRGTQIGPDATIGADVEIGRAVQIGARLTANPFATVGYASVLGTDAVLGQNAALGSLVTLGDGVHVDGILARGVTVADSAQVGGIVGPNATIGAHAVVDGRVRKDADIGAHASVSADAVVGRGSVLGYGVQLTGNASVGARATVPACADLDTNASLRRNEVWDGPMVANCSDPEAYNPEAWIFDGINAGSQVRIGDVTTDPATGNIFVMGDLREGVRVNGVTVGTTTANNKDQFAASLAPDGTLRWIHTYPGSGNDEGHHIAWHDGALYVSGRFATTVAIDGVSLSASHSGGAQLIARLDPVDGTVIWQDAIYMGSSGGGNQTDLHATADGVFITGAFGNEVGFGTFNRTFISNTHNIGSDGYIAHLSPSGQWMWERRIGGTSGDTLTSVSSLPDGTLIVAGHFSQTLRNGNALISGIVSSHAVDSIVLLVDPSDASVIAHETVNGTSTNRVVNVTATSTHIVASAYYFGSTLTFGPDTLLNPGASGSTFEGSNLAILIFDLALNPVRGMDAPAAAATGIIPADLKTVGDEVFLLASFSGVGDATFGPNTLTAPGVLLASIDPATTSWNWGQLPSTVGASGISMTPYNSGGVPQMLVSGRFSGGTLFWDGESYPNANGIAGYVANVRAEAP